MKSKSLAPIPATLAFSAFLVTPGFAAETAPAPAAAPATTPAVDTKSEAYTEADKKTKQAAENAPVSKDDKENKLAETTVSAKREETTKPYLAESTNFKRSTPLLDTPQQITVVSRQVLQDRNAVNLKDALKNSPGITFNAGEGGNSGGDNFNMRGFNAQSDLYIDGVRDTALYNRDAFFIESVEIAKGSSGVYSGRGSTGGSINLITKTAHAGNDGSIALTGSSANSVRAVADANVDISKSVDAVKDQGVAFRMVALAQDGGTPRSTTVDDRRFGLMPSLSFGLGSQTKISLSHIYYQQDSSGDYGIPFGPPPGSPSSIPAGGTPANPVIGYDRSNYGALTDNFTNWYGSKNLSRDDTTSNITSAIIESDIDDMNKLRNITRYNSNLRDTVIYRPNGVGTALSGLPANGTITPTMNQRYVQTDILSNQTDYVGNFKTGDLGHTLNLGLELQQEKTSNRARTLTGTAPVFNLQNPDENTPDTRVLAFSGARTQANAETYGLYANETLHVIKQLDLIGGVRYDHFDATVKNYNVPPAATTSFSNGSGDDMVGWRGGVVVKPTDNWSLYGTVANSFNPSAGDLSIAAKNQDLKPEESYLYEVGTKWEPIKDRLSFSVAYFYIDKFNLRQTDPNNANLQSLTGEAVSQGVEFTTAGAVTKKWNIFGGFVWNTTEVMKDSPEVRNTAVLAGNPIGGVITTPNLKGKELANTPDYSATLWTTYDIGLGWAIGGGIRYTGTRYADAANTAQLDDYVVCDLALYKQVNKWVRIQVNVDNVADTQYIDTARAANDGWATPGAGRVISGTIRVTF